MLIYLAACIMAPHALTGILATTTATYSLMILTTVSLYKSYRGILEHKIDVHRAFTIRVWGHAGAVGSAYKMQPGREQALTRTDPYYETHHVPDEQSNNTVLI